MTRNVDLQMALMQALSWTKPMRDDFALRKAEKGLARDPMHRIAEYLLSQNGPVD